MTAVVADQVWGDMLTSRLSGKKASFASHRQICGSACWPLWVDTQKQQTYNKHKTSTSRDHCVKSMPLAVGLCICFRVSSSSFACLQLQLQAGVFSVVSADSHTHIKN